MLFWVNWCIFQKQFSEETGSLAGLFPRLELPEVFFLLLQLVLQQIPVAADSSNIWFAVLQPVVVLLLRTIPEWVLVQWYQLKYPAVLPDGMTVLLVLAVVQQLFPLLTFPDIAELVLALPVVALLAVSPQCFSLRFHLPEHCCCNKR